MDRDTVIESYLARTPGARLLAGRVADGAWFARITFRGQFQAIARATSLSAALDALAEVLASKRAA